SEARRRQCQSDGRGAGQTAPSSQVRRSARGFWWSSHPSTCRWPDFWSPFCSLGVAVNFDNCRIDHGELHVWIIRYSIENPLENARLHPIAIALEHRIPVAERRRQISPGAARARDPKHSFEKQPVVTPCAAGVRGLAQTKRLHLRPLSIRQNESVHSKLLSELESRAFQSVNPESQQTLGHRDFQNRPLTSETYASDGRRLV